MTNLASRIVELSPAKRELFARKLAQRTAPAPRHRIVSVPRRSAHRTLSFAQERLWTLEQMTPGLAVYNMSGAAHVRGSVDEAAWERALNEVVRRHEILRTTFAVAHGRPIAVVSSSLHVRPAVLDMRRSSREEVERVMSQEAARPFDLERAPAVRVPDRTALPLPATSRARPLRGSSSAYRAPRGAREAKTKRLRWAARAPQQTSYAGFRAGAPLRSEPVPTRLRPHCRERAPPLTCCTPRVPASSAPASTGAPARTRASGEPSGAAQKRFDGEARELCAAPACAQTAPALRERALRYGWQDWS